MEKYIFSSCAFLDKTVLQKLFCLNVSYIMLMYTCILYCWFDNYDSEPERACQQWKEEKQKRDEQLSWIPQPLLPSPPFYTHNQGPISGVSILLDKIKEKNTSPRTWLHHSGWALGLGLGLGQNWVQVQAIAAGAIWRGLDWYMYIQSLHLHLLCLQLRFCNGGSVTGSRHSQYTESNVYSSCIRVELGYFVHVSDVLYRLHITSVTNTIYGSYQYLQ